MAGGCAQLACCLLLDSPACLPLHRGAWTEVKAAGGKPRARCCTALFALEHRVLMFGGDTYGAHGTGGRACGRAYLSLLPGACVHACPASGRLHTPAWVAPASPCPLHLCCRCHQRAVEPARPGGGRGPAPVDAAAAGGASTAAAARPRGRGCAGTGWLAGCQRSAFGFLRPTCDQRMWLRSTTQGSPAPAVSLLPPPQPRAAGWYLWAASLSSGR